MANTDDKTTAPEMGAITDRQLLVDMAQKMSGLLTTVRNIAQNQADFGAQQTAIVERLETVEEKVKNLSQRAKDPSQHDLDAQKALAAEVEERKALAAKVDELLVIGRELKTAAITFWKTPLGKYVYAAAIGALAGWLAKNNIHIPWLNQ